MVSQDRACIDYVPNRIPIRITNSRLYPFTGTHSRQATSDVPLRRRRSNFVRRTDKGSGARTNLRQGCFDQGGIHEDGSLMSMLRRQFAYICVRLLRCDILV